MKYWPALDGLRAVAVLSVMLFHAQFAPWHGGFLGVDIFFVLSGFLITAQLLQELRDSGRIRWTGFFVRRLVRLQPALLLLLFAYAGAWSVGWVPGSASAALRDIGVVLLGIAHWARAFGWHSPDYLGHAWSLGIEEQFYLLWAVTLAALGSWCARPWRLCLLAMVGAIASVLWMQWLQAAGANPSRLYNGLDTRAMALLWGCALAGGLQTLRPELLRTGGPSDTLGKNRCGSALESALSHIAWAALLALIAAMIVSQWKHPMMFRWGYFTAAFITAVLLAALVQAPASICSHILGSKPLVAVGKISYGLYLWHYPLYRIAEYKHKEWEVTFAFAMCAATALTLCIAWGSYFFVERPLRSRLRMRS